MNRNRFVDIKRGDTWAGGGYLATITSNCLGGGRDLMINVSGVDNRQYEFTGCWKFPVVFNDNNMVPVDVIPHDLALKILDELSDADFYPESLAAELRKYVDRNSVGLDGVAKE